MNSILTNLIKEDSVLPDHIKIFGKTANPSECKVILLTGVTGNLGPYLLKNLVKRPKLKIYCLVRKTSTKLAEDILGGFGSFTDIHERVKLISGDLSLEKFGIGISEYENLCLEIDAVVHSAVKSNHLEMYGKHEGRNNDLRSVNVLGTLKIMEFATTGKAKRIYYASSILGCNRINDFENVLCEELIEEDNYGDGITMGYAVCKFICDKLMSQAIRRGIPCFVIRFPLIIDDGESDSVDTRENHYYCVLLALIETGMKPEYPSGYPALTVNACAKISIDLFFNDKVPVGIYNLLNPRRTDAESLRNTIAKILEIPPWKHVSFSEFSKAVAKNGEKSILYPFRKIYFGNDAEAILAGFNLTSNLLLTQEGGKVLSNVSNKLRKYVPDIDTLIEEPEGAIIKFLRLEKCKEILQLQITKN